MRKRIPNLSREKESRILAAAQRRFAHYGLAKVTIGEIADDVGMGKATLYYYFPTKEEIFKEVIRKEQDEFLAEMRETLLRKNTAAEKLQTYVESRIRLTRRLLNLGGFVLRSGANSPPGFREMVEAFSAQELETVAAVLSEGKRSGEFSVASPGQLAAMILHVIQGLRLRHVRATQGVSLTPDRSAELEREMRLFVQSVLHGIVTTLNPKARNSHE
jgi:TetR/AcrR family transcriptional repressor of mexJK operon